MPSSSRPTPRHESAGVVCEYCGKVCSRPSNYVVHLRTHTGERPFQCPVEGCGKDFAVRSNLNRHLRATHQVSVTGAEEDEDDEAEGEV